jgi:radical SAM superfamily enzyme YgiQ (UPF0313 family)
MNVYYLPYEQGPIRPPSEANSLLIRITRNCPWNRCEFCKVYDGYRFEIRKVDEIKEDIVKAKEFYGEYGSLFESAFLQDANSIIMKTDELAEVIEFIKENFPSIKRITTYGRAKTLMKKSVDDFKKVYNAGLSRIHMGLETGYDPLLEYIKKGATSYDMTEAGRRVKDSGISLCVYIILGLGGRKWWKEHAIHSAKVINGIDPDFIRVRTLSVRRGTPLREKVMRGDFERLNDEEIVREERLLIENLENINSYFVSDHILNLLEEVEGKLPNDKEYMLSVIDRFLNLSKDERFNFILGKRIFLYKKLDDINDIDKYEKIKRVLNEIKDKEFNQFIFEQMERIV